MKERVIQALFTLLRSGLWDKEIDNYDCFPLDDGEWNDLFQLSVNQTVEALVFDGVQRLESDFLPKQSLLVKWLVRVEKIGQRNTWMDGLIAEQLGLFNNEDIEPILVKGQGLARCYLKPERRLCGDIDWYFESVANYDKANAVIREENIDIKSTAGFSTNYLWRQCEVEHHRRLVDLHNPFCQSFLGRLEQAEKGKRMEISLSNKRVILSSPLMQCVQVSTHILKHLLSFGVGLRQLCDVARLYFTYHKQIDGANLRRVYQKVKIEKWISLLHKLLTKDIGLPTIYLPYDEPGKDLSADWMMREILRGGNFGFHEGSGLQKKTERNKDKLWRNAIRYFPYAPVEACSFPVVHFYSRFVR